MLFTPDAKAQRLEAGERGGARRRGRRGQGAGEARERERREVRRRGHRQARGLAFADTLAESGQARGGRGGGGREASRARIGEQDGDVQRLPSLGMQAALKEAELLVSATSGGALGLRDVPGAGLGKQLGAALGVGAALQAPLDDTGGGQEVLVAG